MADQLRIKSPFSQLAVFLGALGFFMIITFAVSSIAMALSGFASEQAGGKNWADPDFVATMKKFQAISSVSLFLLPALLFAFVTYTQKPLYNLGLRHAVHDSMYWMAVVCMLASFPVVSLLGELNQALPLPSWMVDLEKDTSKQLAAFLKADNAGQLIINVLVMAFLPALGEELAFRGALQTVITRMFRNPWTGIIITAVIFSALHMQFLGFLPRVFLGIVLGAIYLYSGSLWTTILAHFVYNGVQVVGVAYAPEYVEKNPTVPLYYSLPFVLLVVYIIYMMKKIHDR